MRPVAPRSLGIYLHFPYCRSKCPYCDFASQASPVPHRRYARAIVRELAQRGLPRREVHSLYLGGGTPSLWSAGAIGELLEVLEHSFQFATQAERTVEVNPDSAEERRLRALRQLGFNRLSIGVQSFDPKVLLLMGRRHTAEGAAEAARSARAAGFENLSLDLIFGSPGQDLAILRGDLDAAISLEPEHLSCYALTLTELAIEVPMAKWVAQGTVPLPSEEEQWEMGDLVRDRLASAGYERYEISNYARGGHRSRHNDLYWTGGEYLGLGCGAVGFLYGDPAEPRGGGRRWGNYRDPAKYLRAIEEGSSPEEWSEQLSAEQLFAERMAMGLRRVEGVDLARACEELGRDRRALDGVIEKLVGQELAVAEGATLRLTPRGLDLHTEVAARFV